MAIPPVVNKIVGWLRAGYPEGVPQHDYMPIFALLGTQLTNDEVTLIADELAALGRPGVGRGDQGGDRRGHRHQADRRRLARVRAHLAAGGWPLATPHQD